MKTGNDNIPGFQINAGEGFNSKMNSILMKDDETLEELQPGGFKLLQKRKGFRFGMDSVLLAHFAYIREKDHVVDFGTGSCVLPLLLLSRNKGESFHCIEIQHEMAEMAERTVMMNKLEPRIKVICGDATKASTMFDSCSVDCVISNPPYAIPGSALSSPDQSRAISRNQSNETLEGFFSSAFRILKGKGRFSMVYPAAQMFQAMTMLKKAHLEPKRFQLVYPYEDKPANLVLIEAVKDAKASLHPLPPLIVYNSDHVLTNKLKSVYHMI